jgi:hypothetical protein
MYWHAVTGRFLLDPYQGEHFNWLAPQIWNFLFSIRRGLFVWSPVVLIAAAGLPLLVRRDKPLGFAVCAVLALEVYICSSWWSWWFGDSFGSRPIADMAPLIALPLASSLEWIGGRTFRFVPAAIVTCLIGLNLFLMVSYWNELFPWDDVTATDLLRLPLNWENHHLLVSDVRRRLALATPYTPGTTFRADTGAPPGMWLQGFTERRVDNRKTRLGRSPTRANIRRPAAHNQLCQTGRPVWSSASPAARDHRGERRARRQNRDAIWRRQSYALPGRPRAIPARP